MIIEIIQPNAEIMTSFEGIVELIESCGRTCYKSEDRITATSADRFVRTICRNRHESVLEHAGVTVRIVGSRAMSHQLVRHRIASYSQESQRYVNYAKNGYQVICPPSIGLCCGTYSGTEHAWLLTRRAEFEEYENLLATGIPPEDARYSLPNAAKTEVVTTYNLRQWRHVFQERALNKHAQWEIRGIMLGLFNAFNAALPSVFADLSSI